MCNRLDISVSDMEKMIKEAEIKALQDVCTHLYQGKECLTKICENTYQCSICGKQFTKVKG